MPDPPVFLSAVDTQQLLESLGDAVVVADGTDRVVYVNAAGERLLGWGRADLVGQSLATIIPERLRDQHDQGFRRYHETGEPHLIGGGPVTVPALRRDGVEIEIELSLSSHRLVSGQEVFVGSIRDLSDRIALERERNIARYLTVSRDVTARLALVADTAALADAGKVMLDALGEGLGWQAGAVWEPQEGVLVPVSRWAAPGYEDAVAQMTTEWRFESGVGAPGRVLATGEAAWFENLEDPHNFPRRDVARASGLQSCFAFPIFAGDAVVAVVDLYAADHRAAEPELLAILQSAGGEIGRLLERAEARRHRVQLAEALQASLLPPHLPAIPGLDLAVRYRAAAGEGQVGGDFFDVFPLPDGEWGIVIGDVSGRGPRAAALTALARYTIRAAAVANASPSAVLQVLNDVVRRELETADQSDERFLTVAYVVIAPSPEGLRGLIACGGHPSPLVRRHSSPHVESLACEGELVGVFDAFEARDSAVELRHGDAIVLITDGVLEGRGEGDEFGEERLRQVVGAAGGESAVDIVDAVEAAVLEHVGGGSQDDLAIVVLKLPQVADAAPPTTADLHSTNPI